MVAGGPATIVKVNVAGIETPETLVVTLNAPAVEFAVAVALASPLELVVAGLPLIVADAPFTGTAAKVTVVPETGMPLESVTIATSGLLNPPPIGAVCGLPLETFICAGGPAGVTTMDTDIVWLSMVALADAVPPFEPAVNVDVAEPDEVTMLDGLRMPRVPEKVTLVPFGTAKPVLPSLP
jgi:hypothetical protein